MPAINPVRANQLLTFAATLTIAAATALGAFAQQTPVDKPPLLLWKSLEFEATKLMITARSSITAIPENVADAQAQWFKGDFHGRNPQHLTTLRLSTKAKMLGRSSLNTVWLDPSTMAAYQRTLTETGSRMRKKIYRFGTDEVLALRSSPESDEERKLPEPQWTRRSEQRIAVPKQSVAVTDPVAIFYAIATRPLDQLDKGYELTVLTSNRISRVRIQRTNIKEETKTRAPISRSDDSMVRDGSPTTVTTQLYSVTPLGAEGDLKILGLEGAIEVIVDEELRMPLEIRGRIPPVGRVTVRLTGAQLH